MKAPISQNTSNPPYIAYGSLIHEWRNEIKFTKQEVAQNIGVALEHYEALENGQKKPSWDELEKLAKEFVVSVRDLLPATNDLDRGVVILRDKDARTFDQERNGKLQYTYACRAMSSTLPNFKPVELELHLHNKEDVVINRGHFFHQYTQVLHGGPVGYMWEENGIRHYEEFIEGDSWLIPGFVPHAFWSPDPKNNGKILAITFGQHLASSDAKQELQLIGAKHAERISGDNQDYYKKK